MAFAIVRPADAAIEVSATLCLTFCIMCLCAATGNEARRRRQWSEANSVFLLPQPFAGRGRKRQRFGSASPESRRSRTTAAVPRLSVEPKSNFCREALFESLRLLFELVREHATDFRQ